MLQHQYRGSKQIAERMILENSLFSTKEGFYYEWYDETSKRKQQSLTNRFSIGRMMYKAEVRLTGGRRG